MLCAALFVFGVAVGVGVGVLLERRRSAKEIEDYKNANESFRRQLANYQENYKWMKENR